MNMTLSTLPKTWILDLDGTLVVHNGYKIYGHDVWLEGAREFLQSVPAGDMIVFLTSRDEEWAAQTEAFLRESGVRWNHILYGAPYGERILVNDDKPSGLRTAYAVSRRRDSIWNVRYVTDAAL